MVRITIRAKYDRLIGRCVCPDCGSSRRPYWRTEAGAHVWRYLRCPDCDLVLTPYLWIRLNGWVWCRDCRRWAVPEAYGDGWRFPCRAWSPPPITRVEEIVEILRRERGRARLRPEDTSPVFGLEEFGLEISEVVG